MNFESDEKEIFTLNYIKDKLIFSDPKIERKYNEIGFSNNGNFTIKKKSLNNSHIVQLFSAKKQININESIEGQKSKYCLKNINYDINFSCKKEM